MKFSCFKTQFGWVAVVGSDAGLIKLTLPKTDEYLAMESIPQEAKRQEEVFEHIKSALIDYFDGKPVKFDFPFDLSSYTNFQKDVWSAARNIPYGQLRNYGWLAAQIGRPKAAHAVGQALGANPLPIIIPCHRIIRNDGSLGGFSGGLVWKKKLISLENEGSL